MLGSALPLIRPRLPLPPKGQVQQGKKEDGSAEAEGEAETSQQQDAVTAAAAPQPITFRRMASNTRLLAFLAANGQSAEGWDRALALSSPPFANAVLQGFGYFVTLLYLPTFATVRIRRQVPRLANTELTCTSFRRSRSACLDPKARQSSHASTVSRPWNEQCSAGPDSVNRAWQAPV